MKLKYFLSIGLLASSCLCSCGQKSYKPGDPLTITSIEMADEYGDATLIQFGAYDILVDSGNERDANHVKSVLNAKVSDKEIDLLVVTHPHGDHIGGINAGAIDGFKVKQIVDYGYTYNADGDDKIDNPTYVKRYINKRNTFINAGAKYEGIKETYEKEPKLVIDKANDLSIQWLKNDYYVGTDGVFPNDSIPTTNPNTTSVSFCLTYKYWNVVMCGDADTMYTENSIAGNHPKLFNKKSRTILKGTHHASNTSMGYDFMHWANPELIFVSAALIDDIAYPKDVVLGSGSGQQNHPNKSTVRRMKSITENIYWNGINGDITITVDGVNDFSISGAGRSKNYKKKDGSGAANIENEKNVTLLNSEFGKYF